MRRKGYPFVVLSSDAFAKEKLLTMTAFGADLRLVPSDGGKVTPALFERFRTEIARLPAEPNTFWTDQFHNTDALEGYADIGREMLTQTERRIDVFCGAVGTGGGRPGARWRGEPRPNRRARADGIARDDAGTRRRAPCGRHRHRIDPAAHVRT